MNILSTKTELTIGGVGVGLGTGPAIKKAVIDVPFYESEWWLAYMAIAGAVLITLMIVNRIIKIKRDLKGETRDD